MSSSKNTQIAVVGAGKWGINHIKNLSRINKLGAIVEANSATHESLKKSYPSIPIYKDISFLDTNKTAGVVVATPVNTHFDIGKELLNKKFSLLIEKPTTTKLSQTEELVKIADQQNLILMTGYLLLYQPAIVKIKQLIDEGAVGEPKAFHFNRLNFGRARSFENAFWSLGVHDVAVFCYLSNETPEQYSVHLHNQRVETQNTEDEAHVTLKASNNTWAHFHSSWNWPQKKRELTISCTKGFIVYNEDENKVYLHKKEFTQDLQNKDLGTEEFSFDQVQALELELEDFISSIENKYQPKAGRDITLKSAAILERILNV